MPTAFNRTLNANEIYASLANMILSQRVFADNIKGTSGKLADMFKYDVGLYGDMALFYATQALPTHAWGKDAEAANLLALDRPQDPFCQKIVIDTFKQIRLTLDDYLTKRAWSTEGAFAQFNAVMQGWITDTKRIYDSTLVNNYVGKTESTLNGQTVTVTPVTDANTDVVSVEASNRLYAESIAKAVADEFTALEDINRINDLGYLRSWSPEDLVVIWNASEVNKIKKFDMPTLFHKEGLIDKFEEVVLPENYFINVTSATETISTYAAGGDTLYAAEEMDALYKYSTTASETIHYFPGEKILKTLSRGTTTLTLTSYTDAGHSTAATAFRAGDVAKKGLTTVVCKIVHKNSLPFMSAFETGTNFFNPRSLTDTHYLTFGHNTLQYLYQYPWITIKV